MIGKRGTSQRFADGHGDESKSLGPHRGGSVKNSRVRLQWRSHEGFACD